MKKKLNKKLNYLKKREVALKLQLKDFFSSEEEYKNYVESHRSIYEEINIIKKNIIDIEWQLMTEKEKKNHQDYLELLKQKFNDG